MRVPGQPASLPASHASSHPGDPSWGTGATLQSMISSRSSSIIMACPASAKGAGKVSAKLAVRVPRRAGGAMRQDACLGCSCHARALTCRPGGVPVAVGVDGPLQVVEEGSWAVDGRADDLGRQVEAHGLEQH